MKMLLGSILVAFASFTKLDAADPITLELWPEGAPEKPGFVAEAEQETIKEAGDDPITATGSALMYLEYKKLGIPAELHIYSKGGHGLGMKPKGAPVHQWHVRVAEWLDASGLLDR